MEGHPDLNVPIIADPDEKLFLNYSVRSVPQIVLIDKFGNIAYYSSPRQNAIESLSEIEHEIISLLNKEKTIDR